MNRKLRRSITYNFVVWTFAFAFWTLMRNLGQEGYLPAELTPIQYLRINVAMGIGAGILFGVLAYFMERWVLKRVVFGVAMFITALTSLITIALFMAFGRFIFSIVIGLELDSEFYQAQLLSGQMFLFVFYCFLVSFIADFIKQVDKKFGPGNLWRMLTGKFHRPQEDERIFMFLDLKDSTTIAETLGHIRYSKMIQDCFQDLDAVQDFRAEVYQYVGDEAVLTWPQKVGLKNANCLRAYFAFTDRLAERAEHYQQAYGLLPHFKAGLNIGTIVVAEVGEIKREIAYHGDTINTAARIQGQCNALGKNLLISEALQKQLLLGPDFLHEHVGDLLLKGKSITVNIYAVEALGKPIGTLS